MQAVVRAQQPAVRAAFAPTGAGGHVAVGALARLLRQLSGTSARDVMLVVCRVLDMDLSGESHAPPPAHVVRVRDRANLG